MKRLLTLALVFAVMAAFAGLSAGQGAQKKDPQKSPSTSSAMSTKNSAHATEQIVTGKVLSVNPKDKTFTVVANGKQVTFFANKLLLPDVGKMMDIHYIQQTPGGPMEATTIQPTPGGTFAVTNLNSSRSNISRSVNTSATSKAMEPPPEKPKQEVSTSGSGTIQTNQNKVAVAGDTRITVVKTKRDPAIDNLTAVCTEIATLARSDTVAIEKSQSPAGATPARSGRGVGTGIGNSLSPASVNTLRLMCSPTSQPATLENFSCSVWQGNIRREVKGTCSNSTWEIFFTGATSCATYDAFCFGVGGSFSTY